MSDIKCRSAILPLRNQQLLVYWLSAIGHCPEGGRQCMAFLNDHYLKLRAGYLFPEIARRVSTYAADNPGTAKNIIRWGIGDVPEPLPAVVREAMHRAVDEMGQRETFRGYGPEQGYEFLRHAIAENDYRARGL